MTTTTLWRFVAGDAPRQLSQAGDELESILSALGATQRARLAARVVAEEIVLNALEHGRATFVTMQIDPADDPRKLVFEDDGLPFDPSIPPPRRDSAAPVSMNVRGRGLTLVHGMTKSIAYSHTGGLNRLSVLLMD